MYESYATIILPWFFPLGLLTKMWQGFPITAKLATCLNDLSFLTSFPRYYNVINTNYETVRHIFNRLLRHLS